MPPDFPLYVGRRYESPFRASRIEAMLEGGRDYTPADFGRMQMDAKTGEAPLLLPRLLGIKPADAAGQQAVALLAKWDQVMDAGKPEPLIYTAWVRRLQRALVEARLGATQWHSYYDPTLIARLLDADPGKAGTLLESSLDDALAALQKEYGADMTLWRWGDAHRAALKSQMLGAIPILGRLFDASLPVSGGDETVNRAGIGRNDGVHFPDVHGPGYRGVFDLSDLDRSRFIIATGQSGDPLSPHYDDLATSWRDGNAITLSGTADEVAARGIGRQRFVP